MAVLTIRNVPEEARDLLARAAKRSGQSLQAYLLAVLEREARFSRNAELADMEPVGGGLLSMDEIVDAVRAARGEGPGGDGRAGVA
ncbi:hypothetical protein QFW96_26185 [Saccharopolyspora sp. TS4A08]|uniref:Antitoxin FitA-like ribbon-helix-helix domain-containing protein n=1 Tax=Saccharopolyspora ipomoeae TaxID=3042027 RepID=A0ABT6PVU7_9PSEU|nr:hypothetical protein [Saccharopolyspora sp. TS4A08]MDI2032133.1 hypothetical protein [Saccharopolyspora sp. TS4A08]